MNKIFTGIGSRSTPPEILEKMKAIAKFLSERGYTLRSGGADGGWNCKSPFRCFPRSRGG